MNPLTPKDLLDLARTGLVPDGPVAVDTETSGLFADDGARVSTVSVAWEDVHGEWMDFLRMNSQQDRVTWNIEEYAPDKTAAIVSLAWPFDQGTAGKPEDKGQNMLFAEADNLDLDEWQALLDWLHIVGGSTNVETYDITVEERKEPVRSYTGPVLTPQLIFHNAKFDWEKLRVGVRRWPGAGRDFQHHTLWDTQNVCDLIWPLERTSLKPTSARLFGADVEDESKKVKAYLKRAKLPAGRWDLMPWDVVGPYADMDPRLTLMVYLRQRWEIDTQAAASWLIDKKIVEDNVEWAEMEKAGWSPADFVYDKIERRLRVTRILYRMEWRGLPYPEIESREAAIECKQRAAKIAKDLPFAPPTDTKAKDFFFRDGVTSKGIECLNLVPYGVTPKNEPSMTAEILTRMVNDGIPHAARYAEYVKAKNAASMWYDGYADKMGTDGRLRTAYRQNGTVSTRFSVERVNLQAIPQDYRLSDHAILDGILTPRQLIALAVKRLKGWKPYELDLAQAELRVGAMFANCVRMLQMIEDGTDLHAFTTQALFHMDLDDPQWGKYRQVGKRGNFSLQFGSGGDTFRRMVSKETGIVLEPTEADRIVEDWNALYPEYRKAIRRHEAKVVARQHKHGHGWIDLINGERRWFQPGEEAHKAFNQRVQGNLAQFGIDWMIQTENYLTDMNMDQVGLDAGIGRAGLVLTIHDSQVLLLPDTEEGAAMAEQCAAFGRELWKQRFPGVPGEVDYHAW